MHRKNRITPPTEEGTRVITAPASPILTDNQKESGFPPTKQVHCITLHKICGMLCNISFLVFYITSFYKSFLLYAAFKKI